MSQTQQRRLVVGYRRVTSSVTPPTLANVTHKVAAIIGCHARDLGVCYCLWRSWGPNDTHEAHVAREIRHEFVLDRPDQLDKLPDGEIIRDWRRVPMIKCRGGWREVSAGVRLWPSRRREPVLPVTWLGEWS